MFSAILFTVLNNNLDNRTAVADLFAVANTGPNTRRMVRYNANTLNTPYKAGLTSDIDSGLAIITMGSDNYGSIVCIPEGGTITAPCFCNKTQTWGDWGIILTSVDLKVQNGSMSVRPIQNSTISFEVIFPEPFSVTPTVNLSLITTIPADNAVSVGQVTTTKFIGHIYRSAAVSGNMTMRWTAIGK